MTSPTINHRVMEFALQFPPFNLVEQSFSESLASEAIVRFYKKDEELTDDISFLQEYILIIKEGLIYVSTENSSEHEWYSEGDLPTMNFLFDEHTENYHVKALEDTLVYAFPFQSEMDNWLSQSGVALFFGKKFSRESAVSKLFANDEPNAVQSQSSSTQHAFHLFRIEDLLPKEKRKRVIGDSALSVAEIAQKMTASNSTAIVILDAQQYPVGIVTDSDLRRKVATGKVSVEDNVEKIMSSPVITLSSEVTLSDAQLLMMHHNMHHLCITESGSADSPFSGMITKEDIIQLSTNHPIHLLNRIARADSVEQLKELRDNADSTLTEYFELDVATHFITGIITEINDALIKRIIELTIAQMEDFPLHIPFAWMSLGSEGRGEQMLRTDQDNALVYGEGGEKYKDEFLTFASRVCDALNKVGFELCPAEIMANNPKWNMSVEQWKTQYTDWISTPSAQEIMHSTIFFDARAVYGDETLVSELKTHIFSAMEDNKLFIHYMAANALQNPPPQGFFRNILVEKDGKHKDQFDIKARALMPLTDIARTLLYSKRDEMMANTMERYEWLSQKETKNRELFQEAKEAVAWLLKVRTLSGLRNNDSGRYIDIDDLTRWQRKNLRQTFKLIDKLQQLMNTRYRLDFIRN